MWQWSAMGERIIFNNCCWVNWIFIEKRQILTLRSYNIQKFWPLFHNICKNQNMKSKTINLLEKKLSRKFSWHCNRLRFLENSLAVQWLGIYAFTAKDRVQSLVGELRSLKSCDTAKNKKKKFLKPNAKRLNHKGKQLVSYIRWKF